ncbi:MAG: hypothetical protein QM627_01035 [Luteolibacter sp.]
MKLKSLFVPLVATGFALAFSSCVDPYYTAPPSGRHYHPQPTYRPGYEVRTLPPGYSVQVIGGTRYYYHNNVYYRSRGGRYVVVDNPRPSRGGGYQDRYRRPDQDRYGRTVRPDRRDNVTVIRTLPRGARSVTYRGQSYYRHGNTYYQPYRGGYRVVSRPY